MGFVAIHAPDHCTMYVFTLVALTRAQASELPRGLHLGLDAAAQERASFLADQFVKEFEQGNFVSTLNISYGFKECDQICSNWCWATSASMTASAFGDIGDCGSAEAKVAGHEFGAACDTSCSGSCNQGGTMTQTSDGIKFLSGQDYHFVPNALSPSDLETALKTGPVVAGMQWSLGGGHAVTINGISGGNYVGHDPEGYPINTDYIGLVRYSPPYCQYPCFGTWMAASAPGGKSVVV